MPIQNNSMKKILLTIITATLFAVNAFAQDEFKEGHITYSITVTGNDQAAQMMNGSTMSLTVKDSMSRVDMNMSMMNTIAIMNNKSQKGTMLMNMMGNKYAISLSPQDIKDQEKNVPDYDVKYIDSTKVIAGHICKKAIIIIKQKGGDKTFTVWYDPAMKISVNNKNMYNKVNGLPLEYTMEQGPIDMEFTCTSIDGNPVDVSVFTIPDGYQTMTMDQFKQSMGGMGGH